MGNKEKCINVGVPQGSVLSPFLFNIYIDNLIQKLESINQDVWVYADDTAFGFRSESEFKEKINICERWTARNKMMINDDKCELMIVKGKKKGK